MKESLKQKLIQYIQGQGGKHIPHWQLMMLVKQWGFRESNAERRLRESDEVGKEYEKGCIKAYYWKTESLQTPYVSKILNEWETLRKKEPQGLW